MTFGFLIEFIFLAVFPLDDVVLDPKLSSGVLADALEVGLGGSTIGSTEGTGAGASLGTEGAGAGIAGAGAGLRTEGARVETGAVAGTEEAGGGAGADAGVGIGAGAGAGADTLGIEAGAGAGAGAAAV